MSRHGGVSASCPASARSTLRAGPLLLAVLLGSITLTACVSGDGRTFAPPSGPPDGDTTDLYILPLAGRTVSAVRIETATGGFFDSLREVSVYP